jgi:ATP-dependent DNA helicase RecG
MIEAWGRGFEKIKEACGLYNGPLPEYEINESGIMVLCKACDKYLELLRNVGQNHDQVGYDSCVKFFKYHFEFRYRIK